ncbi:MAG: type IV pili methyl-accepting chemotaxis transducer N-terminal domain-containing protein [Gammaproteobacteria bacterium]|nr:type IV pili methyl-accepting chemotaxis transducer N-terminal domain-containing protein [Gammaproteobacteria bacterium]
MSLFVRLFLLCAGLLAACPSPADTDLMASLPDTINRAARQRMLSQRLAKAWLMQATGNQGAQGSAELLESTAQFDKNLKLLAEPARLLALGPAWEQANSRWQALRASLGGTKNKELAARLLKESNELLRSCDAFVSQLTQKAGHSGAKRIALAGLSRMLSQRLAKAYLAKSWQVPYPGLQREIDSSQQEFDSILSVLLVGGGDDAQTREHLHSLQGEWMQTKAALRQGQEGSFAPEAMLAASARLLVLAEALTQDYQRLGMAARR